MRVILRSNVANIGCSGEVKDVSPGFARNYLIPKNLAMEANAKNLKVWGREKTKLKKQNEELINSAKEFASKMEVSQFTARVTIGENGKIFGSVTTADIAKIFKDGGFEVNKRDILLSDNIKKLGNYDINVKLHPEVVAKIKLSVVNEKD